MAFCPKICLLWNVKSEVLKIDPESLGEYERVRRDFVRLEFSDKVLRERFGLSPRHSAFAREYALNGNMTAAALFAGFARKTAKKNANRIYKKCAPAVEAMTAALVEKGDGYKVALKEHLTAAMLDILDNRGEAPAPAVMACKMLFEMYRLDVPPVERVERDDISESEIESSLKRMGKIFGPVAPAWDGVEKV